jgi:hypothetical protein
VKQNTLAYKEKFEGLHFTNTQDSIKIKEILHDLIVPAFANLKQATKLLNGQEFESSS